jgi:hypothetical protein
MANPVATGAAPSLSGRSARLREPSGLLLRLRTWFLRPRLDADIMDRRRRAGDAALLLRETQLVEPRRRKRLAKRLEEVVAVPVRRPGTSSRAPVDRRAVAVASPVLTDLILLLRSPQPVEARGMALGWRLLTDPASPLYEPEERESSRGRRLWGQSLAVLQALRPTSAVAA